MVYEVNRTSPLLDMIFPRYIITAIDDVDTQTMSSNAIM